MRGNLRYSFRIMLGVIDATVIYILLTCLKFFFRRFGQLPNGVLIGKKERQTTAESGALR